MLKASVANVEALKAEVNRLNTALLQEASKTKALSEELETPLNVHRCDPPPPPIPTSKPARLGMCMAHG